MDEVDRLKRDRETVVIYSADHGEMLGDRNRFFKSVPYQPAVHIPLVISGPGVLQNNRCGALVQLHDLAATITGFAGLSMPPGVDSKSLLPLAANDGAPPVRGYQYAALYTHMRESGGPAAGYEEYAEFQKRFDRAEPFPAQRGPSGWRSVITERFKYVYSMWSIWKADGGSYTICCWTGGKCTISRMKLPRLCKSSRPSLPSVFQWIYEHTGI